MSPVATDLAAPPDAAPPDDATDRRRTRAATLLALGVLALMASIPLGIMALPLTAPAGDEIVLDGTDFFEGTLNKGGGRGAERMVLPKGPGPAYAIYNVVTARAGRYRLDLHMASPEPRPVNVSLDGEPRGAYFQRRTADGSAASLVWTSGPELTLDTAPHLLVLQSDQSMPHYDRLRLVRRGD